MDKKERIQCLIIQVKRKVGEVMINYIDYMGYDIEIKDKDGDYSLIHLERSNNDKTNFKTNITNNQSSNISYRIDNINMEGIFLMENKKANQDNKIT